MLKIRNVLKTLKFSAVALVLYFEFAAYFLLPLQWTYRMTCPSNTCINILLVADPQILGDQDSSKIAKWDCDRYLAKSFSYAVSHVLPDVIIFLGDETDEGHISSDHQFNADFSRFRKIFHVPDYLSSTLTLYVPGDNDIGGDDGPIIPHTVHRFDKYFDQSLEPSTYQFLEFYKVNKMTLMFQEPESINNDAIRIAISHMPILKKIHTLGKRVASSIKPHIVFSGHDHTSFHVSAPISDVWRKKSEPISNKGFSLYSLSDSEIHEIVVPTCSYRMGVPNMGFGMAHIDVNTKTLSYSVLWLPRRLHHLLVYLGFLIVTIIVFIITVIIGINRRLRRFLNTLYSRTKMKKASEIP